MGSGWRTDRTRRDEERRQGGGWSRCRGHEALGTRCEGGGGIEGQVRVPHSAEFDGRAGENSGVNSR